ncbi:hypothetical protein RHGRI_003404 [Rhododendron griersonianum]|uniref:ATP-dependent (S)-NAD(P)H-hydrate dehydratase n=1 Tax=Rhododendron griersonianum TaxID=479676 RepID=A0AAV6L4V5_9ERIC|nr:hypothetical protein RHGRI_003404 [Rhododendron griersonianum]
MRIHCLQRSIPSSCMLNSSAIIRRQQFLIRALGGCCSHQTHHQFRMQSMFSGSGLGADAVQPKKGLDADACGILRLITPPVDPTRYKGQADRWVEYIIIVVNLSGNFFFSVETNGSGKIAVIGGCREYTGAPYFSAISALKIGADLSHVFCTKDAAPIIKGYSPELIVHPVLEESYSIRDEDKKSISERVLAEVEKWMERFDCLVVGPGLGRDPFLLDCVSNIIKHARRSSIPIVIDADGLFLVTNSLDLISGYPLAILTPNINEYKRLVQSVLNCEVNDHDAPGQLLSLAKRIGGVTILRKGKSDLVSDGNQVMSVSMYGSPRRCGGQGDILSGRQIISSKVKRLLFSWLITIFSQYETSYSSADASVAVFVSWARQYISSAKEELGMNPTVLGCIAGSALVRKAALLAFENKRRSTLTGDIIECLGRSLDEICPLSGVHRSLLDQ